MIKADQLSAPGGWITSALIAMASREAFARLDAIDAKYEERRAGTSPVYQVFIEEPVNGLKVELNFAIAEAEAAGRTPAISV